jgi:putative NADPH-quinone reductase
MRVLVLFAHPVETSFGAAIHAKVVETLKKAGHEVDDLDLNAEGFQPVLTRQERLDYHDTGINRAPVEDYVRRVLRAEALVISTPIWNFGFPAILKGFFDRVFLPGVSFEMRGETLVPCLHNIKKLGAVVTYGGTRWRALLVGDPPRKIVKRVLRATIHPLASVTYLAQYDMNHTRPEIRAAFLKKVEDTFSRF